MTEGRSAPRYMRIADALRARIRQSRRGGAERLPSEHALCRQFHVSRMTVRQALDVLRHEGLSGDEQESRILRGWWSSLLVDLKNYVEAGEVGLFEP